MTARIEVSGLAAVASLADAVGIGPDSVELAGALTTWRGPFAIDDIAVSSVAVALSAAAELLAVRNGTPRAPVVLDARHAALSFWSDVLVEPLGWELPPVWDPIAGDYRAADGWIRLHTNYGHHRVAALRALGVDPAVGIDAAAVGALVAQHSTDDLEAAVVAHDRVAAGQRSHAAWAAQAAGRAVRAEPLLDVVRHGAGPGGLAPAHLPFDGVRVVDLTRVLAGPTATGFLAAWGADVLRIDPPGFAEVPAIVPVTMCGKRGATLDLRLAAPRRRLLDLIETCDVVVHGYRSDALAALGLDPAEWHARRPGLVEVTLDAYGWTGPWSTRRGFDSLVQHSTGITRYAQDVAGSERPVPLPCQALDYGCGWLLAAAVAAGLVERCRTGCGTTAKTSLARFAELVMGLPRAGDPERPTPTLRDAEPFLAHAETAWGPLRRMTWPGTIDGCQPRLLASRATGRDEPAWS